MSEYAAWLQLAPERLLAEAAKRLALQIESDERMVAALKEHIREAKQRRQQILHEIGTRGRRK